MSASPLPPLDHLRQRIDGGLEKLARWLARLTPIQFVTYTVVAALLVVALVYPPRIYLLRDMSPHDFDWNRGFNFILQCQDPFFPGVEPALRWRLLPALIGQHLLGRNVSLLLSLGPLGVVTVLAYLTILLERRTDRLCAFFGVILLATTSGILTACDWVGINDPWAWLGVLVAAFSPRRWTLVTACVLCPWIDERFILALPLALLIRCRDDNRRDFLKTVLLAGLILAPYVLMRLIGLAHGSPQDRSFLRATLDICGGWAPYMPLAWWLAFRAIWVGMTLALFQLGRWAVVVTFGTLIVTGLLACDLTKSVAVLFPLAVLAILIVWQRWPRRAGFILATTLAVQLLLPDAHIVNTSVNPILPLPLELLRINQHSAYHS